MLDIEAAPPFSRRMRIGELAQAVGVSPETVRFYERAGLLPAPARRENAYRDYGEADAEHLRLVAELRRLDVPLAEAGRIASLCHSGHCTEMTLELPEVLAERRTSIASRIAGLRALDARLESLERHLEEPVTKARSMRILGPCCDAAQAVFDSATGTCPCCAPTTRRA